jgi:hypothetical protein
MSEAAVKRMTVSEFLRWEDGSDTRYELLGGLPVAMAPSPVAQGMLAAHLCGRDWVGPAVATAWRGADRRCHYLPGPRRYLLYP